MGMTAEQIKEQDLKGEKFIVAGKMLSYVRTEDIPAFNVLLLEIMGMCYQEGVDTCLRKMGEIIKGAK